MGPVASPVIPDRPVGREQRAGRGTPNGSPARCANPLADKLTRNGSVTLLVPLDPYVLTLAPRPGRDIWNASVGRDCGRPHPVGA